MFDFLLAIPYPRIDPTAFAIGPFSVRWYALAYVAGLIFAWWHVRQVVAARPAGKRIMEPKDCDDLLFWATFGVVLGGRIGYVLFYKPGYYIHHLDEVLSLWKGGMSFHGGLPLYQVRVEEAGPDLYDGTGFDALADSKLQDIKIGLGFNDKGMEQVAGIKGLRHFAIAHGRTSDAGITFFEGHPSLESFSVAEMGKVSERGLASIAKMPKVTRVGFGEAFITYESGFRHLLPMRGRLKELDLTMSVVNQDDLKRVQADHPDAKITVIPPAEIVKRHSGVANALARAATGPAAEELKRAIAEHQTRNK